MSSSIISRFNFTIAGSPFPFAASFAAPTLVLDADPAIFTVDLTINGSAVLWAGLPLPSTFDVVCLASDRDCDIEFTVDGGAGDEFHFTLFCRGGGFPLTLWGDASYAGQTGTQDAFVNGTLKKITKIRAKNRNTTLTAQVSLLLGKVP